MVERRMRARVRIRRTPEGYERELLLPVPFVPMIGPEGLSVWLTTAPVGPR